MGNVRISRLRAFVAKVAGLSGFENGTAILTTRYRRICNCWWNASSRRE